VPNTSAAFAAPKLMLSPLGGVIVMWFVQHLLPESVSATVPVAGRVTATAPVAV
jgi:hypothetical protein